MIFDDKNPKNRKKTRLEGYDYNISGMYFLTLCAKNRAHLFSRIAGCGISDAPSIELSDYGKCIDNSLIYINDHRQDLLINHYVIMPIHVHLLVTIKSHKDDDNGTFGNRALPNDVSKTYQEDNDANNELALKAIPKLISSLKRYTNKTSQVDLWQNGYYDHIIRDEQDYLIHWKYIVDNPAKWAEDKYYDTSLNSY